VVESWHSIFLCLEEGGGPVPLAPEPEKGEGIKKTPRGTFLLHLYLCEKKKPRLYALSVWTTKKSVFLGDGLMAGKGNHQVYRTWYLVVNLVVREKKGREITALDR